MTRNQIAALVVAAVLAFWMVGAYNRLVGLRNAIGQA
jgi:LemA protein